MFGLYLNLYINNFKPVVFCKYSAKIISAIFPFTVLSTVGKPTACVSNSCFRNIAFLFLRFLIFLRPHDV